MPERGGSCEHESEQCTDDQAADGADLDAGIDSHPDDERDAVGLDKQGSNRASEGKTGTDLIRGWVRGITSEGTNPGGVEGLGAEPQEVHEEGQHSSEEGGPPQDRRHCRTMAGPALPVNGPPRAVSCDQVARDPRWVYRPTMVPALLSADPRLRAPVLVPTMALVAGAWILLVLAGDHSSVRAFAAMWLVMSIAMMIPTTVRPMLRAADGSVHRAWTFLSGFTLTWLVAGIPAYFVMNAIQWTPFWIALAWIAAGVYQVLPMKHRLVRRCSSVPFTGGAMSYGLRQGMRCVASCTPIMLAAMVTAMALPGFVAPALLLLGITVLLCWEREPSVPRQAMVVVGMAMMLAAVAGVMFFGGGAGHVHS